MSKSENLTNLERLVVRIQEAGMDWVESKLQSDQLEADEKNFLAALINDLEKTFDSKVSDTKLERIARGTPEFRQYVTGRVTAQAETLRRKVEYEARQNLWEARRSELAFERAKVEKGIFGSGR